MSSRYKPRVDAGVYRGLVSVFLLYLVAGLVVGLVVRLVWY